MPPQRGIIGIRCCDRNGVPQRAAGAAVFAGATAPPGRYTFFMNLPNQSSRTGRLLAAMLLLAGSLLPGSARAASADSSAALGRVLACRAIASDQARLHCFDRASAALARNAEQASKHPQQARAELTPRQTFGLTPAAILAREVANGSRPKPISDITERVTGLHVGSDGRVIYDLANGQVWRELQDNGNAPPLRAGERVQISRGWLGSYWLQAPSGRGCKVERIH